MTQRSASRLVHVVRLGTAAAPLNHYLRGHEDGVSWTSEVDAAIPFDTPEAAKRYAARRIGGSWHVAAVDRGSFRVVLQLADEVDSYPDPEERDAGIDAVLSRLSPESTLIPRAQGLALAAHRAALRVVHARSAP